MPKTPTSILSIIAVFVLVMSAACASSATVTPNNNEPTTSAPPAVATSSSQPVPLPPLEVRPVNPNSPIGINLSEVTDYTDEDPFLDYMKTSRAWFGQTDSQFDTQESDKIDVDDNGWVRSLTPLGGSASFTRVTTIMMVSGEPHNNYAGEYVVLYEGTGALGYGGASVVESGTGRDVIRVNDASGYLQVQIIQTDPQDYLRNIRVVRKEYEQNLLNGEIFNPVWLAKLQPFRAIRFMDWMRTNRGEQRDFATRPLPAEARYTSESGVPAEMMLALANQVQAEPWFNMPTQASDEYITAFATLTRDTLDPNLNVYVEYSNEVWNTGFPFHPQGGYIDQQAAAEFGEPTAINGGFFTARMNWHGKRTAEMCAIWKSVFGDQAERVTCVLGAQAANTFTADEALQCPLWQNDPQNANPGTPCLAQGIDAVAIAPYFGSYIGDPSWQDQVQAFSVDQLFEEIFNGGMIRDSVPGDFNDPHPQGALAEARSFMQAYQAHANQYGYRLIAYEGGQHLAGILEAQNNQQITDLFNAANRDPRMGQAYTQYLRMWQEIGGETFMHFYFAGRYSQFGSWGLLEFIEQDSSPKFQAVVEFTQTVPCWWEGC